MCSTKQDEQCNNGKSQRIVKAQLETKYLDLKKRFRIRKQYTWSFHNDEVLDYNKAPYPMPSTYLKRRSDRPVVTYREQVVSSVRSKRRE